MNESQAMVSTTYVNELNQKNLRLRELLTACVETYDAWDKAENTPWHAGALDKRIAACRAWDDVIDAARAELGMPERNPTEETGGE